MSVSRFFGTTRPLSGHRQRSALAKMLPTTVPYAGTVSAFLATWARRGKSTDRRRQYCSASSSVGSSHTYACSSCSRLLACVAGLCLMKENSLQGRSSEEACNGDGAGGVWGAWGLRSVWVSAGPQDDGLCLENSSRRTCLCQSGLLLHVSLNWGSRMVATM